MARIRSPDKIIRLKDGYGAKIEIYRDTHEYMVVDCGLWKYNNVVIDWLRDNDIEFIPLTDYSKYLVYLKNIEDEKMAEFILRFT